MTVALSLERGVMGGTSPGVPLLRHFRDWAVESGAITDPLVRERMARVAIDNEVATLLTQRSAWIAASGGQPSLEGSMTKIFSTETYQKASRWFFEAAAPHSLEQLAAQEKNVARQQQLLSQANALGFTCARIEANLLAANRLLANAQRQRAGLQATEQALHYVAPVGEKDEYVKKVVSVVQPFISEEPA